MNYEQYMDVHPDVARALSAGKPVVALESTIISHGMPYPDNIRMAAEVEKIIRDAGAVPATIGIIQGRLKAGLTSAEIDHLGKNADTAKVSRRDLPVIVATGQSGATTVAATMIIAEMAGIRVFVTGGIGGVHRGAETTMDISADLEELAQSDVAVVCAGAKSILDIGLTLEYLETRGVPVLGYQTGDFPAFYTRTSGFRVDYTVDSAAETAAILRAKWGMGLRGGVIVANPVPEAHEMDVVVVDTAIHTALEEAAGRGIAGKGVTPFLLARVVELTGGASLRTNIQLVYSNARVGAKIACAYSTML
ncbi:MAG: pseudouridine-5'-phosphate glycosidase [Spirochaetaceae bacterium]